MPCQSASHTSPQAPGVARVEQRYTTYEPMFELRFDSVEVAAVDVLAGPEQGADALTWIVERSTAALCAHQLGVTDVAMRMTASYTAEREQFGVPIATFQAVGHRAANCFIDVECLRLNTYQAVSLLDAGQPARAATVYREDLEWNRDNPWAMSGLCAALSAAGSEEEAAEVCAQAPPLAAALQP